MAMNWIEAGWNLAKTVIAFGQSGGKLVDKAKYNRRLAICDPCDYRSGRRCTECKCFLPIKAALDVAACPKEFW